MSPALVAPPADWAAPKDALAKAPAPESCSPFPMHLLFGIFVAILLVLSFLGWGRLASVAAFGESRGDWPFQAAWGICVVALLGGVLNALGAVSVAMNLAILAAGLVLCGFQLRKALPIAALRAAAKDSPRAVLLVGGTALVAFAIVVVSLHHIRWEPNDDAVAYAMFPRKMLDTGRLVEPFSNRRIVSFGGYHYLHSLILSALSHGELQLLDRGLGTALTGAGLVCFARRRLASPWVVACLAGLAFLLHPPIRVNLASTSILSLLSFALLETFLLTGESRGLPVWKRAALLALAAAGLLSMRANALAILGPLTLALVLTERRPAEESYALGQRVRLLVGIGLFAALLLFPWALALAQSSGTPFYPVVQGYYNAAIPMSVPMAPAAYVKFLWENITYSNLQILFLLAVVGAALRAVSLPVLCYVFCSLLTAIATMAAFNLSTGWCMARYHCPFTRLAFILTLAAWMTYLLARLPSYEHLNASGVVAKMRIGLIGVVSVLCAIAVGTLFVRAGWGADLREHGYNPVRVLEGRVQENYKAALPLRGTYRSALATIPDGSKVLAAVDAPFLLDFTHHDIVCIDDVGVVSPPPGLPVHGDAEALASYLTELGFTHLLHVKPARSTTIYTRTFWGQPDLEVIWKLRAPYFLWFFDAIEKLDATREVTFDSDAAVLIALNRNSSP